MRSSRLAPNPVPFKTWRTNSRTRTVLAFTEVTPESAGFSSAEPFSTEPLRPAKDIVSARSNASRRIKSRPFLFASRCNFLLFLLQSAACRPFLCLRLLSDCGYLPQAGAQQHQHCAKGDKDQCRIFQVQLH